MKGDGSSQQLKDVDPNETNEWLLALDAVLQEEGAQRVQFLIEALVEKARSVGAYVPYKATTRYVNTIPPAHEAICPGDMELEGRIRAIMRWNAMAMVVKAGRYAAELGGHIASYASSATLYEVGFNHFWHARNGEHGGDMLYIQGHVAPGIYARAYLEGRIHESQLARFRQEVDAGGLSSYPHPYLMPDFWQFPTVSMGLGPIQAIYQARFSQYLHDRGLVNTEGRKIWCFCGDGEMDEPESLGAISLAGRERLDNLIFVINCNLQRLDGPVRGNGKIIQELEGVFRGAGWNVIKVIWGGAWDPLLARDTSGILKARMEEAVDGDYQNYKAHNGAYTREHFFGQYPELKKMVEHLSDDEIWHLNRGGHDPQKVYAAYASAVKHVGQPTVILAKTVKGYGMGRAGEAQNVTHQQKKMDLEALKQFRDRFRIPIDDQQIADCPFYRPAEDSPEIRYIQQQREKLGGYLPARHTECERLMAPPLADFQKILQSTGDRTISTTMAFVRILNILLKNKSLASRIVPIIPDEARTFGMEGLFRQLGIYSSVGQLYKPVDHDQVMYYREDRQGQLLEEGITEAGALSSWIAAATSYANHGLPMIPFYIFYSMFGFQRIGDLAWAAGDSQARGFLLGATSGRTTLAGEGLQHQDGQSHLYAATIPNCISYDPTYAYELAVIIQDGMRRMYQEQENIFYYITLMNENYTHPELPEGVVEGILAGMYCLSQSESERLKVRLLGSGAILREVEKAASLLQERYQITAEIWSVTSFTELAREGQTVERHNRLNPTQPAKSSYVTRSLAASNAPVIAASDYNRAYAEQIRAFVPANYHVLGTDGFGRSDTRAKLRAFFEVNANHIVLTALHALVQVGEVQADVLGAAAEELGVSAMDAKAV